MPLILVVDDEEPIRLLLRDTLELDSYEVTEAADGPAALAVFAEQSPDVVILDIMMPGMSGIEVLRQIRQSEQGDPTPVILLTAAGDDRTTYEGWAAGASCYLTKPFDPDNLLEWVERVLP